jgi:hypothetical protein
MSLGTALIVVGVILLVAGIAYESQQRGGKP